MKNKSLLMVNLAVLLFGMAGILAKSVTVSSVGITFGRVLFSSLTLFVYMKITNTPIKVHHRTDLCYMMVSGAVLAVHWVTFLQSVKISTVAIGTITFSSFPLFVTFLEPLVYKTKLTVKNLICALVMLLGVAITVPQLSAGDSMTMGVAVGMVSALCYAVLTLLNKQFSARYFGTVISFYEQSTATVLLLPFVAMAGVHPRLSDILLIFVLGVVTTALAHTLYISSLKGISAYLAGIISSMETVYGIAFAFLFLGEIPTIREICGGLIILSVVLYSQLSQLKQEG